MIEILLKIFVPNYKNVKNNKVRTSYGILGSSIGFISNLILVIMKLIIGFITLNVSIIADAINNLSDFFSCILNIVGCRLAGKPADKEHPYGHERIEYIISLIISVVIMALAINIIYQGVMNIINPGEKLTSFPLVSFIILAVAAFVKLFQSLCYYALGKRISSISLMALGADARNDIISTIGVIIGLVISYYTGFTQVDGIIAILVGLFILYSGFSLLKETSDILIGEKPSDELVNKLVKLVKAHKGVLGIHDLEIHSYGPDKIFASIHVEVDGDVNVFASHEMIDGIEKEVNAKLGVNLVVHMDPINVHDPELAKVKASLTSIVKDISNKLSFHDLRLVNGKNCTNVIFDLVIPNDLKNNEKSIIAKVTKGIKSVNQKYNPKITIDEEYTLISNEND